MRDRVIDALPLNMAVPKSDDDGGSEEAPSSLDDDAEAARVPLDIMNALREESKDVPGIGRME